MTRQKLSISTFPIINKNKKFRSFKSKEIIHKKAEDGPKLGFGYKSLISDPIKSGKKPEKNTVKCQI